MNIVYNTWTKGYIKISTTERRNELQTNLKISLSYNVVY